MPADVVPVTEDGAVDRENAVHNAFARSRFEDAYEARSGPQQSILTALHQYCDDSCETYDDEEESIPVMCVHAAPGSGKSTLLANWVRHRAQTAEQSEVIFEHYAGISYDSIKLSLFLFRLMSHLKAAFQLHDFVVPSRLDEEKLQFRMLRCLEAAANSRTGGIRRRIILVIDGVDRLRKTEGYADMSWLPKKVPKGVRIIMSSKDTPSLKHRNVRLLPLGTLDAESCEAMIRDGILTISDRRVQSEAMKRTLHFGGGKSVLLAHLCIQALKSAASLCDPAAAAAVQSCLQQSKNIRSLFQNLVSTWSDALLEKFSESKTNRENELTNLEEPSENHRKQARKTKKIPAENSPELQNIVPLMVRSFMGYLKTVQ
jgi:hypothetical protein